MLTISSIFIWYLSQVRQLNKYQSMGGLHTRQWFIKGEELTVLKARKLQLKVLADMRAHFLDFYCDFAWQEQMRGVLDLCH